MRRVPDVLDCWFESGRCRSPRCTTRSRTRSGSSPLPGRLHRRVHRPDPRLVLHAARPGHGALFDRPAFQNCVVHGVLLGDDGQKLSEAPAQLPRPDRGVRHDRLRRHAVGPAVVGAVRGGDMVADRGPWRRPSARRSCRSGTPGTSSPSTPTPPAPERPLPPASDRARPLRPGQGPPAGVEPSPSGWTPTTSRAPAPRSSAYLDSLNNWYIRRSRDRFWAGDQAAVDTLHTVLEVLCRVAAPLLPLLTDTIWPALTGGGRCTWPTGPTPAALPADPELVAAMDAVREVCSAASSVRKAEGLRVRLPLRALTVAAPDAEGLCALTSTSSPTRSTSRRSCSPPTPPVASLVLKLARGARAPGRRRRAEAARAAKEGDYEVTPTAASRSRAAPWPTTSTAAVPPGRRPRPPRRPAPTGSSPSTPTVTPELEAEGLARDLVRAVNEARRAEGLHVSDRIRLIDCVRRDSHADASGAAVEAPADHIAAEVLATELVVVGDEHAPPPPRRGHRVELSDGFGAIRRGGVFPRPERPGDLFATRSAGGLGGDASWREPARQRRCSAERPAPYSASASVPVARGGPASSTSVPPTARRSRTRSTTSSSSL